MKTSKKFLKIASKFQDLKQALLVNGLEADKKNSMYSNQYASLPAMQQAFSPIIYSHNFLMTVDAGLDIDSVDGEKQGNYVITVRLTYIGKSFLSSGRGEWFEDSTSYPITQYEDGNWPKPQKLEATRTYGTRCTLSALFGLVATEKDDDGNLANHCGTSAMEGFAENLERTKEAVQMIESADSPERLKQIELYLIEQKGMESLSEVSYQKLMAMIESHYTHLSVERTQELRSESKPSNKPSQKELEVIRKKECGERFEAYLLDIEECDSLDAIEQMMASMPLDYFNVSQMTQIRKNFNQRVTYMNNAYYDGSLKPFLREVESSHEVSKELSELNNLLEPVAESSSVPMLTDEASDHNSTILEFSQTSTH